MLRHACGYTLPNQDAAPALSKTTWGSDRSIQHSRPTQRPIRPGSNGSGGERMRGA